MQTKQSGFTLTLIEALVVMAIVGILAWVAIPEHRVYREYALDMRVERDVRIAAMLQGAYFKHHGTYFPGLCENLPGFKPSKGVTCTMHVRNDGFVIKTSHPQAKVQCVWSSNPLDAHGCWKP